MFPDFFNFRSARNRGALQRMIGNAVPPPLSKTIAALALPAIQAGRPELARQMIDYQRCQISANGSDPRAATISVSSRSLAPAATSDQVRRRMQVTRQRDTTGEQLLRRALDEIGLSYVVDAPPIAGSRSRADFVVQEARVAVYWDGCFWHACPEHGTYPKANADWWRDKLTANRLRDAATDRALRNAGWLPLRFWGHEDPQTAATAIAGAVRGRAAR
jgi:DNA mismatch endonuclease (patch repair protein)